MSCKCIMSPVCENRDSGWWSDGQRLRRSMSDFPPKKWPAIIIKVRPQTRLRLCQLSPDWSVWPLRQRLGVSHVIQTNPKDISGDAQNGVIVKTWLTLSRSSARFKYAVTLALWFFPHLKANKIIKPCVGRRGMDPFKFKTKKENQKFHF